MIFSFLISLSTVDSYAFFNPLKAIKNTDKADDVRKISKLKTATTISCLVQKDLQFASKAENIQDLMNLAVKENRLNFQEQFRYIHLFQSIEKGDVLLLKCLKDVDCNIDNLIEIMQKSSLHKELLLKKPSLSLPRLNHAVGSINENLMKKYFTSSGWKEIVSEIGRNGIDGLYVKKNKKGRIVDVLIVESKYNKSGLQHTQNGQQMTKDWIIKKIDNLRNKYPTNQDYSLIHQLIVNDNYRALLWHLEVDNGKLLITTRKVQNKQGNIKLTSLKGGEKMKINFTGNQKIDLEKPSTDFHKKIVNWYKNEIKNIEF